MMDISKIGDVLGPIAGAVMGWFGHKASRAQTGAQVSEYRLDSSISSAAESLISLQAERITKLTEENRDLWQRLSQANESNLKQSKSE